MNELVNELGFKVEVEIDISLPGGAAEWYVLGDAIPRSRVRTTSDEELVALFDRAWETIRPALIAKLRAWTPERLPEGVPHG